MAILNQKNSEIKNEAIKEVNTVTLSNGTVVTLKEWALRPGIKHINTAQQLFIKLIDFQHEQIEAGSFTDGDFLKRIDLAKISDEDLSAFVSLVHDACDLTEENIEQMPPHVFIECMVCTILFNVSPLKGLRTQLTAFIEKFTIQPQK